MFVQLAAMSELSDDLIWEQAYLVSRGVRPLALVGSIPVSNASSRMATQIRMGMVSDGLAIPFVFMPYDDDFATCGFAAENWVIDLLKWSWANMPRREHELMLGLMLGYAPNEIRKFDEIAAEWNSSSN